MPTRPTWSGTLQISLVSIAVKIFPATNPGRQVEFHQIDRKTHKRIHHQNVDESGAVDKSDIVKGFAGQCEIVLAFLGERIGDLAALCIAQDCG